ncbi:hypothetical protein F4820DRAFT_112333 [Hypoxylon rubiginosum]|uniref:Uncharacterized protein n=1 Tax=Hypoxylon rubiginosum TaxID=110542 RepID=A0ACB9Z9X8_9PEZI|nr:hypothetical protein F4820DRAFT_112333 [Hypoxylon rubiginosum]
MPFAPAPTYIISQHTFTDCDSQPALSVYRGILSRSEVGDDGSSKVLPPLFSFQVYVTYGVTLASAPEELKQKFVAHALADMQDSGIIRFDIYFRHGALPTDIVRHYRAENKALSSYSTDANAFRGVAVILTSEHWESTGVELLFFDPPAQFA